MARITEFTVEGLAGRNEPYSQRLDRYLNVFFGLNGSGKTSLLKIFHAAMVGKVNLLQTVPFKRAQITIYSIDRNKLYTYTYEKPKEINVEREPEKEGGDVRFGPAESRGVVRAYAKPTSRSTWTVEPDDRDGKALPDFGHGYLPIARLYMSEHFARSPLGPLREQESITEEQLEESFAVLINSLWSSYSAGVFGAVQRAQAKGLADILKAILTGKSSSDGGVEQLDPSAVYDRVSRFMERQGSPAILGDAQTFQKTYQSNRQLRSVIADINKVELRIQEAMAPRDGLQSTIEKMFTGNKTVTFTDSAIDIRGKEKEKIGLARLSSGEKQLIRIFVDTLIVGPSSLILDEPEISMHVDWQRHLIAAMRQLNQEVQLITATHSPEIMAEIPDANIFRL